MDVRERARERSDLAIAKLRERCAEVVGKTDDLVIGINGSYARREAVEASDLDMFVLFRDDMARAARVKDALWGAIKEIGLSPPSPGGVFEEPLPIGQLRDNIGGREDSNTTITRRLLLLLEGNWLFNQPGFDELRMSLLEAYAPADLRTDQICLFLLNDIIRYWRTICVDYEFKIKTGAKAKLIRLVKLRFSRMILYFAGVLAVAETRGLERAAKIDRLGALLAHPPLERIEAICGDDAAPAIGHYTFFLEKMDCASDRKELESIAVDAPPRIFEELRGRADDFRRTLVQLLRAKYDEDHPILTALIL